MTIITPFHYQKDCLDILDKTRHQGIKRALVVMATGLGKTVVAALDVKKVVEKKSWRVLYLAHQNQILEQARDTFEEVLGNSATYGFFTGEEKIIHEVTCLFASFQTMQNWRESFNADEFDYVIVDESHHSHAKTYLPTIQYFKPKFLLAITATPDRKDLRNIRELYGNEVFSISLEEALAKSYLTPVEYLLLLDEVQAQKVIETPDGKLSIKELNRRLFIPMRDEKIVETILEKSKSVTNPRTVIFCSSIRHCENIAKLMPNAVALHSKVPPNDQRIRLTAFRSGDIPTLVTVDKFNEGIDIPAANVIVFLRSTSSRTIFMQQLGRGLRKAEGKSSVLVLDFAGNCERMELVHQLIKEVAEYKDQERSVENGAELDESVIINHTGNFYFSELVKNVLNIIDGIRTNYTSESLILQLQDMAIELGYTPLEADIRRRNKQGNGAHLCVFERVFGIYDAALAASGLESSTRGNLIWNLQVIAAELGHTPTMKEVSKRNIHGKGAGTTTYIKYFGSFNEALNIAGLTVNRIQYTKEQLILQLQIMANELGHNPTSTEIVDWGKNRKGASKGAFLRQFGTFQAALEAAGLDSAPVQKYTEAELLSQLQTLAQQNGKVPTTALVKAKSKEGTGASVGLFYKYFGSFNTALEKAGLV